MPLAAREDDPVLTGHGCDGTTNLNTPSQSKVFVAGKLWCRITDPTDSHDIPDGEDCVSHTATIGAGSDTVFVVGLKAARYGDACDAGSINTPTQSTVFAGP